MKIIFSIAWVNFYSPENGFSVLLINLDKSHTAKDALHDLKQAGFKNKITVTGSLPQEPDSDKMYSADVKITVHPKYGPQLEALLIEPYIEPSKKGIESYLKSGHFKGVGTKTAEKIYTALGEDALNVIRDHPESLDGVVKDKVKETIIETLNQDSTSQEQQILGLCHLGLTVKEARRVYDAFKDKALTKIKQNPYNLMFKIKGFGFEKADRIALANGIKKTDDVRLDALTFYLHQNHIYQTGDSYALKSWLYNALQNELNKHSETLDRERYEKIIQGLAEREYLYLYKHEDDVALYDYKHWTAEQHVALQISEILKKGLCLSVSEHLMDELTEATGIHYSSDQMLALKNALKQPVCIITGGPGTGKSTLLKALVLGLAHYGISEYDMALVAPTGRAAKRMAEVTQYSASTIHRFLGFDGKHYAYNATNPHKRLSVLIIDETSMVDVSLMARLLDSVPTTIKLILVGDKNQLPSVGPGDVLNDTINSEEVKTVYLTQNHRQDSDSAIIPLASQVGAGQFDPELIQHKNDIDYKASSNAEMGTCIVDIIHQYGHYYDILKDIQILIPMYKGEVGIEHINQLLQKTFNPNYEESDDQKRHFFIQDKVIQIRNDVERGVMNGDIGIVIDKKVYANDEEITVKFDSGEVTYNQKDYYDNLTLAYAITIHKAQGSEFKMVIMPLSFQYYIMLRRKLLYTGITRAKEHLFLLGDIKALAHGSQYEEAKRLSHLTDFIKQYTNMDSLQLEDKGDMSQYVDDDDELSPFDF